MVVGVWTHLVESHVPEPLLRGLVLSRLLGISAAIAPAYSIDKGPSGPHGGGPVALRNGIVENPLD